MTSTSPRPPSGLAWHHRLEARVLLSILLLVGGATAAVTLGATRVMKEASLERSRTDMRLAREAFQHLQQARAESVGAESRLIVELPIFRSLISDARVVSERDARTLHEMSEEYRRKLNAGFCLVTDGKGTWLGTPAELDAARDQAALEPAVRTAVQGKEYRGILDIGGNPFLVVSEPATFAEEEVLGTLSTGYRLDDAAASELARVSGCEVTFLEHGRLAGTSLLMPGQTADARTELAATLGEWPSEPHVRKVGTIPYVGSVAPLTLGTAESSPWRLLLLQPYLPTQRQVARMELLLLAIGLVTFVLAAAGGMVVSRRMTRPLSELADAARAIADGNWETQAPEKGGAEATQTAAAFNEMTATLRHYYQEAQSKSERLAESVNELEAAYASTLHALCRALDTRDNETEGHSERVAFYALRIAQEMGVNAEALHRLEWGGLLHDIGKIGVPDSILRKPGPLTTEETAIMRRHCEWGVQIVAGVAHLEHTIEVIGGHHEWFDGSGYPRGLTGAEIPLNARIFALADALDAITSDRPYRKARPFVDALAEIRRCSGTQFDPEVVAAFELAARDLEIWRGAYDRTAAGISLGREASSR